MPDQPKVSVIIPTYSSEKYLRRCLDSVVRQTYKNLEIIIIDDVSTDSTPQIIEEYAQKDKRIRVVLHSENLGPGATRNEGLSLATGKYVTLMDHDDWQDLSKFEKMVERAEETNADIVFCSAEEYDETLKRTYPLYKTPEVFMGEGAFDIQNWDDKDAIFHSFIPPWAKLISRELVASRNIRFSRGDNKFDDLLFHYMAVVFANRISFVDEVLYTHRIFPASITGRASRESDMYFDQISTWRDIEEHCNREGVDPRVVFPHYARELAFRVYKVKSSAKFVAQIKEIISALQLAEKDFPPRYLRSYKKIMGFSAVKKWIYWLRKNLLTVRLRPSRGEPRLVLFGLRII